MISKVMEDQSKLDHVQDMLDVLVNSRNVTFSTVLMDSWYASKVLMLFIESLGKKYYCPLKRNRLVDDANGNPKRYQRIDNLEWSDIEQKSGKRVKINKFPKNHKVKVFRVVSNTKLTGFVLFFHFANPLKTDMCLHLLSVFGEPLTPFHNLFFKCTERCKNFIRNRLSQQRP